MRHLGIIAMDEDQVGGLIENIYTSAFEEDGWDTLLQTLRTQFDASQAIALVWEKATGTPFFISSTISDNSANSKYESYYHTVDPFFSSSLLDAQSVEPMQVCSGDKFVPRAKYLNTEIYCDFVRHFDMGQPLVAILGGSEDTIAHYIVHRPPTQQEFDTDEVNLLRTLSPHLRRGLRIYREMTGLRTKASLFEAAFDMLAATFLLDQAGRVLGLNKSAENLLSENLPLTVRNGRLIARHPPDQARLDAALAPQAIGAPPPELILHGPCCPGLWLSVTPVNGPAMPLFFDVTPAARVAFLVTAVPLGPSAQSLMAAYGLTQAEAEVTLLLLQGAKAPHIAAQRETSTGTVNSQLKQIYAKTGVDGHAALLVKLLGR